jgi:hypothetical protein
MASILFRAQEWLADRVPGVQYPRLQRINRPLFFKTQMPWPLRVLLVLIGGGLIVASAIALLLLGVLAWAAIRA